MNTFLKLLVIGQSEKMPLKNALSSCIYNYELTQHAFLHDIPDLSLLNDFHCIFLTPLQEEDPLTFVQEIRDHGIETAVVVIGVEGSGKNAVELMKAGATDYLLERNLGGESIAGVLRNILAISCARQERDRIEQALRVSEIRLKEALQIAKFGH